MGAPLPLTSAASKCPAACASASDARRQSERSLAGLPLAGVGLLGLLLALLGCRALVGVNGDRRLHTSGNRSTWLTMTPRPVNCFRLTLQTTSRRPAPQGWCLNTSPASRPPHCRAPERHAPPRPSDAKQQSRPAPVTGHGPWYSRPPRRHPSRAWSAASRSGHVTRSRIGVRRLLVRRSAAVRSASASGARPATAAAPDPRTPAPPPTRTYRPRPPPRLTPRRRTAQS